MLQGRSLPRVTVVDALMGAGKTTLAVRMMDGIAASFENIFEDGAHRFIYITPFLEEVERVKDALAQYSGQRMAFDPKPKEGRKLQHLNELIVEGRNIVATHSLFSYVNEETYSALDTHQYTLLIDEVAEWVERYPISSTDLRILYDQGILSVDKKTRRVVWTDPEGGYRGKFEELRSLCRQGKTVASRFGVGGVPTVLLWQFPVEMLSRFKEVFIFTHLFAGSDMAAYLRLHGVPVKMATIGDGGALVDYDERIEQERLEKVRPLVTVVQDKALNDIGTRKGRENPLSVSWFESDAKRGGLQTEVLKKATYNFFFNKAKTKTRENMWSTYKTYRPKLAGKGYGRAFVPCNARSTNKHLERKSLAYLVNLYHHPFIRAYFEDAGVEINQDYHALLTMTQWVWRSQIRAGKPITIYIPSERMRGLFCNWLDGKLPETPAATRLAAQPDATEIAELVDEDGQQAEEALA
jgi:hypothetical protein